MGRAAQKLKLYICGGLNRDNQIGDGLNEENVDIDDLLKRVLYPKVKGQRGGGFVWSDVERTQIDVLAGDIKESKKSLKKLKQFQRLFQIRNRKSKKSRKSPKSQRAEYASPRGVDLVVEE